ncbi:hypothetical protein [Chitinimonas lacunae]|uniref:Uncharacterized protein n=1 Tax=Chitinimonas lacunae TaxID=1963018 RepID=A0ABV8MU92_9NEIS
MKHVMQKVGLGIGLMATSLGAMAGGGSLGLHTFGDPLIYAKSGSTPMYAVFVPSGNQSSDAVILLEMNQGATAAQQTWTYFVSSSVLSAGAGAHVPGMKYSVPITSTDGSVWSITNSTVGFSAHITSTWYGPVGNGSTSVPSSGTNITSNGEIRLPFSYSTTASGATCSLTFNAYVGPDDYLQYQISSWSNADGVGTANLPAANWSTGSYTITTKSGGATSDTVSGTHFADAFIAPAAVRTGVSLASIKTYTYFAYSITTGAASTSGTIASSVLKGNSTCSQVASNRLALNSSGLVVGGKQGLFRLW